MNILFVNQIRFLLIIIRSSVGFLNKGKVSIYVEEAIKKYKVTGNYGKGVKEIGLKRHGIQNR